MNDIETIEREGLTLALVYDDTQFSYNVEPTGTLFTWHRRRNLSFGIEPMPGDIILANKPARQEDFAAWLDANAAAHWIYPVYIYEHSTIQLSLSPFSCPWDSGMVGFMWCSRLRAEEHGLTTDEEARAALEADLDAYASWCNGEVYGYEVRDETDDSLESCYGFIGDLDYCRKEGEAVLDRLVAARKLSDTREAAQAAAIASHENNLGAGI